MMSHNTILIDIIRTPHQIAQQQKRIQFLYWSADMCLMLNDCIINTVFSRSEMCRMLTAFKNKSERLVNCMFCFLAHLSRRLIGELIVYPCSGVRRRCRRRCPPFSNVFSSETAWPIKAKFYVEPPWEGGTKVYINGPGHMTKMAAMPIYGKNL